MNDEGLLECDCGQFEQLDDHCDQIDLTFDVVDRAACLFRPVQDLAHFLRLFFASNIRDFK